MWVYQGTKPWLFSLIASKSSQVISFHDGFPRDYSDDAVLKLANNKGLAAVLDISSAVILFYGTEDQKSAYVDFKQLRKTGS